MRTDSHKQILKRLRAVRDSVSEFAYCEHKLQSVDAHTLTRSIDPDLSKEIFQVRYRLASTTEEMEALFSNSIHNLRSLVDNTFFQIASRDAGLKQHNIIFPAKLHLQSSSSIPGSAESFNKWSSGYPNLEADVTRVIESVQPFNPVSTEFGVLAGTAHPLYVLNQLSNHDKHRLQFSCDFKQKLFGVRTDGALRGVGFEFSIIARGDGTVEDGSDAGTLKVPIGSIDAFQYILLPLRAMISSETVPEQMRQACPLLNCLHRYVRDQIVVPLLPFV